MEGLGSRDQEFGKGRQSLFFFKDQQETKSTKRIEGFWVKTVLREGPFQGKKKQG